MAKKFVAVYEIYIVKKEDYYGKYRRNKQKNDSRKEI